jgi:hypothetical protein
MKKLTLGLMMAFMMLSAIPTILNAGSETNRIPGTSPIPTEAVRANALISRLYEIKAMDIQSLNATEKKELRKEVKSIKSELKAVTGGVYLSVGAIIIIILLLILLL